MGVQRPLVVYDGVMALCTVTERAHVPEEIISLAELVAVLKEGLLSDKSPEYQPGMKKISRKESQTAGPTPYRPFYKQNTRSDGETDTEEQFTNSYSPARRKSSSSSSASNIPTSVLLPLRNDTLENVGEEDVEDVFENETISKLKDRLADQMNWMKTQGEDCVALETLCSIQEIIAMVQVFLRSKTPAELKFKVNHDSTVTVSYQFLHDFKNDFMMLKVRDKYCMFMSPF